MKPSIRALRSALLERMSRRAVVPINRCYHYRGFRYGGFGSNPYEDYQIGLMRSDDLLSIRRKFADAVLNCRPKTMGEAIQVDLVDWPVWQFPWNRNSVAPPEQLSAPEDNPDVICHHCEAGVLASHINREFRWLEDALASIRRKGYQPQAHGYIRCLELLDRGRSSFLVLDGNHRLGALHALGEQAVEVRIWPDRVRREDVGRWPDVRNGRRTETDSLRLFDRYFSDVNPPLKCLNPARLIIDETPLWM